MIPNFSVDFFSDVQYEYMTAEISYKGQILCQISQDKGSSNMEIEFFHEQRIVGEQPKMKFPIKDFITLIEDVKGELSTYR
ncbi:hypothetical protein [Saccharospirillum salsuginis]|uniref:Uncharacterized protein n=1 Tax=Saccharospirillum salsuginis TaxID=418750 RepID=A0A918KRE4_9GAMM|nr:hypothetical protein [Saccharospirillum salsuginis]GGX72913.1 hypothetical protein GCM10007392_45340 [Saccharospirillum salsuginis]